MGRYVRKRILTSSVAAGVAPGTTIDLAYVGDEATMPATVPTPGIKFHAPELEDAEELFIMVSALGMSGGTTGQTLLRFQRKVTIQNDDADGAWQDFYAVAIVTAAITRVAPFPIMPMAAADALAAYDEGFTTLAADAARVGSWGDKIRIVADVTGDRTGAASITVDFTMRLPRRGN